MCVRIHSVRWSRGPDVSRQFLLHRMGFVFSRLRKKKTRINQLDEVCQVRSRFPWVLAYVHTKASAVLNRVTTSCSILLQEFEEQKLARGQCQSYEKSFVAYLVVVSFLIYLAGAAILYLYFRPSTWLETAARLTPFVVFPVM